MFRIYFQPRGGFWCIQFLVWGLFWVTVKTPKLQNDLKKGMSLSVAQFDSYEAACNYVEEKGIDVAYQYKDNSSMMTVMSAPPAREITPQGPIRRFRTVSE